MEPFLIYGSGLHWSYQHLITTKPSQHRSRVKCIKKCSEDGDTYFMMHVGLAKGLARGLGPRGITINDVQPGAIDTDMNPAGSDFVEIPRKQVLVLPPGLCLSHKEQVSAVVLVFFKA